MINKKKQLLKNTLIILFGKVFTQFLSFIFLPLYTSKLTTTEYGLFDIISTYVLLFAPIVTFQVEMAVFRKLIECRKDYDEERKVISTSIFIIIQNIIVTSILYFLFSLYFKIDFKIYIYFYTSMTIIINYLLQVSRGFGDNIGFSIGSVISGIINLLLNVIFLYFLNIKIEGLFISSIISNIISSLYLIIRLKLWKYFRFEENLKNKRKELLGYSIPLIPNGLIWWVINVSDRTIISLIIGASANGIYAVANKFSSILIQVYNIFNLSWTESVSMHINDKDDYISDTLTNVIRLFSSICIVIICILPFIYNILIGKEFLESYVYIPWLLLGMLCDVFVSFLGSIYIALKLTKKLAYTSLISGIINITINLIFIKLIGIYAAVFSTIIAFFVMALYRYYDIKKYINIRINFKKMKLIPILMLVSMIVYYLINGLYKLFLSIILLALIVILNIEYLKNLKTYIIKKRS